MFTVPVRNVEFYQTEAGVCPYEIWFDGLKDETTQHKISIRVTYLTVGNFGHFVAVGGGLLMLILDFGQGYRLFVGQIGATNILVLHGGEGANETKDTAFAKQCWNDFQVSQIEEKEAFHATAH
jgi:putative addiction module killer protein